MFTDGRAYENVDIFHAAFVDWVRENSPRMEAKDALMANLLLSFSGTVLNEISALRVERHDEQLAVRQELQDIRDQLAVLARHQGVPLGMPHP